MTKQQLVFPNGNGNIVTNSLLVAEIFGKDHEGIIKDIRTLFEEAGLNEENEEDQHCEPMIFFQKKNYVDTYGEYRYMYEMTIDGFTVLTYDYKESNVLESKEEFIQAFEKLDPSILRFQQEITDKKEVEAFFVVLDSNVVVARQFKKALLNELNKRASIIKLQQKQIIEQATELELLRT